MYLKVRSFENGKPIIFGSNSMRTPSSVALKGADLSPDHQSLKTIPEGVFIADVDGFIRVLPRARLKVATATDSTALSLKTPCQMFKVGDAVRAVASYAELHLSGTAATGDTVTIRINNTNYTATVVGTQTIAALAALIEALVIPDVTITDAGDGKVVMVAKDSYKISIVSSSPALTAELVTTDPGYFGDNVIPLGTIQSIAAPNSSGDRVFTLAGNAAYVLPEGTSVGVDYNELLGLYPEQLDFTEQPVIHLAPYYHADGVYANNLPYLDAHVKRVLHGLNIQNKFYKKA